MLHDLPLVDITEGAIFHQSCLSVSILLKPIEEVNYYIINIESRHLKLFFYLLLSGVVLWREDPLIPVICEQIESFLTKLASKFISVAGIRAAGQDLTGLNYSETSDQYTLAPWYIAKCQIDHSLIRISTRSTNVSCSMKVISISQMKWNFIRAWDFLCPSNEMCFGQSGGQRVLATKCQVFEFQG